MNPNSILRLFIESGLLVIGGSVLGKLVNDTFPIFENNLEADFLNNSKLVIEIIVQTGILILLAMYTKQVIIYIVNLISPNTQSNDLFNILFGYVILSNQKELMKKVKYINNNIF